MIRIIAVLCMLLFTSIIVSAQSDSLLSHVHVRSFENVSRHEASDHRLYRRDYLRLHVDSLAVLRRNVPKNGKIVLYIDGIPFDDLTPEFENDSSVIFHFQKIVNSQETESKAWAFFYKKPRRWKLDNKKISIGYANGSAVSSDAAVDIIIIHQTWYTVGIILILALLVILVWLALRTSLLRDSGSLPAAQRPYSLARTQFAVWLLLIASAYVFLWISTGEMPVLTNSSLILLGISGGTSIVAKVIDNSQALHISPTRKNESFLVDILSDENGISIHRLQMMVFTLVIAMIFCHDVIVVFEMPDFDNNLLMLMGISNGTYAGFKTAENNASTPVG